MGYSPDTIYVDIVLVNKPPDGIKGFSHLCKVLQLFSGYDANAAQLYKQAETLPFTILEKVYFGTADNIARHLKNPEIIKIVPRGDVEKAPAFERIIPDEARRVPDLPKQLVEFLSRDIRIGEGLELPQSFADVNNFNDKQDGYRYNSVTGEYFVTDKEGGWQDGWYVIAANYFDDPFYIDFTEEDMGFPVYYSPHGAGKWTQNKIADSILQFGEILEQSLDIDLKQGDKL